MKKTLLIGLTITAFLLSACGSNQNQVKLDKNKLNKIAKEKLDENKPLVNVKEKTKQAEQILKRIGLTGEKLKQELAKQKAGFEIIASAKGDVRKKYILETEFLPQIIKSGKVSKKCTTTNLNNYISCLYLTKTPIDKLLNELPEETKDFVKKTYYERVYSLDRKKLLEKTSDPIAIQIKKEKIKQMYLEGILRKTSACNKLPEKEVKDYCKKLFVNK